MKLIIAGSRELDPRLVYVAIEFALRERIGEIEQVVSGGARGVDGVGEVWAHDRGIPVRRFDADWKQYGLSAGYRRNAEMGAYANEALIIWDGDSRGTANMMKVMEGLNKPFEKILMEPTQPAPYGGARSHDGKSW
jgi:hypothetical protein